jgi:hypothetical protein
VPDSMCKSGRAWSGGSSHNKASTSLMSRFNPVEHRQPSHYPQCHTVQDRNEP